MLSAAPGITASPVPRPRHRVVGPRSPGIESSAPCPPRPRHPVLGAASPAPGPGQSLGARRFRAERLTQYVMTTAQNSGVPSPPITPASNAHRVIDTAE